MTCVTRVLVAFTIAVTGLGIPALAAPGMTDNQAAAPVGFKKDVAPLLAKKCIHCHGPDLQEGEEFRVDDVDKMAEYLAGGDLDGSSLWTEYLAEDASNPMPPEEPLTAEERSVFRNWILTGAKMEVIEDWQTLLPDKAVEAAEDVPTLLWILLGRLHPAAMHFPIALLCVSALFAVIAFGNPHLDKAAMYCLFLGMLGSWVAAASGWGFADFRGWETETTERFQHRWGGIAVAGLSTVVFAVAFFTRTRPNRSQLIWKVGVVIVACLVGFVGHIGGKVHYRQDIYEKPLNKLQTLLFDTKTPAPQPPTESVDQTTESDQESQDPPTQDASEDNKQETTDEGTKEGETEEGDGTKEGDPAQTESVQLSDDDDEGQGL